MQKDFDGWNKIKKNKDRGELDTEFYYYQREIWWCSIGINIGTEINGKNVNFERPILILKKFNRYQSLAIPLTNKPSIFCLEIYFKTIHNSNNKSFLNMSQIRVISSKRLIRKIGMVDNYNFNIIKQKVIDIIK